jgi:2-desacetyl-2-hydroxyethyl bacteriochlorophyllide A dehydrogenase
MSTASSTTMNGYVYNAYGNPHEVLQYNTDLPVPAVGDDDILVEVHASSVNPIDYKLLHGYLAAFIPLQFPHAPGFDVAGVVTAVGSKVQRLKVGDAIFADNGSGFKPAVDGAAPVPRKSQGAFSDFVVLHESQAVLKPSGLSFEEAASLPLVGLTSFQALVRTANVQPGQSVLILGGSGGTGSVAVQIAKRLGAQVTATCGTANVDLVKRLGADTVIDYRTQSWHEAIAGGSVDVVYDTAGEAEVFNNALKVLKPGGFFISIAARPPPTNDKDIKASFLMTKSIDCVADLEAIKGWVEEGALKTLVEEVFPRERVADAYAKLKLGRTVGKLVIKWK